jgi:hypothetical protein
MSKIRAAAVVAFLAVASGPAALHAQDQTLRSRISVPFAFEVGAAHFAPGTYFLSVPLEHTLSVRGPSGNASAPEWPEASLSPAAQSKVVFYRYGDRYFLREVWTKGRSDHLLCLESKSEHRARAIQQAANHAFVARTANVEIALLESPR